MENTTSMLRRKYKNNDAMRINNQYKKVIQVLIRGEHCIRRRDTKTRYKDQYETIFERSLKDVCRATKRGKLDCEVNTQATYCIRRRDIANTGKTKSFGIQYFTDSVPYSTRSISPGVLSSPILYSWRRDQYLILNNLTSWSAGHKETNTVWSSTNRGIKCTRATRREAVINTKLRAFRELANPITKRRSTTRRPINKRGTTIRYFANWLLHS